MDEQKRHSKGQAIVCTLGFIPILLSAGCFAPRDCLDNGCFGETGGGPQACLEASKEVIQFGTHLVGDAPPAQEVVFSDLCEWDNTEIQWALDDPSNMFSYTIQDNYRVLFTIDTTIAGRWEAQFSGVHEQDQRPLFVQLFATTTTSDSDR